uniref:Uncharacterized protein n=1 Tax=virus sp. ctML55 TaxID=2827627 RepID=A0A8S5RIT6_9VIRU|nr:MAG: hypothetical protein [Bacteriophage sp.]DAE30892.1 MAG TPA: hypothetical protein [virus sp. ctML55]
MAIYLFTTSPEVSLGSLALLVSNLSLESLPNFIGVAYNAALSTSGRAEDFAAKY